MKKNRMLGIVTVTFVLTVIIVAAALLIFRFALDFEKPAASSGISFGKLSYEALEWQTEETSGDRVAEIKTSLGIIEIKLAEHSSGEKFISLCEEGAYSSAKFDMAPEGFLRLDSSGGEAFAFEESGLGCFYGAVGFIVEEGMAYPEICIITKEELSEDSEKFISAEGFDKKLARLYRSEKGVPEYEGSVLVFGQVISGMEIVGQIASGENLGYASGNVLSEAVPVEKIRITE